MGKKSGQVKCKKCIAHAAKFTSESFKEPWLGYIWMASDKIEMKKYYKKVKEETSFWATSFKVVKVEIKEIK